MLASQFFIRSHNDTVRAGIQSDRGKVSACACSCKMDSETQESPDDDIADLDSAEVDVRDPPEDETKKKITQDGSEKQQETEENKSDSPLLVNKSNDQDAAEDGGSSSQHVPVNESMVLDALDVLEKRHIRGLAIDVILEYLCLRYPVNRAKDQLLIELSERLQELVEGGLVHLGANGKYRLASYLEQSQQAEGRFGEPAPRAPQRPKSSPRSARGRARPEAQRRRRSGSTSTSSTSSGSTRRRSRSPRQSASRGRPRGHSPSYTREQPRRSKRLMKKRRR